jgi:tetratricopeptide (TPR) repeat protein
MMSGKKTTGGAGDFTKRFPPVSIYSGLSDEDLEELHQKLTAEYGAGLHDKNHSREEHRLARLVEALVEPENREAEIRSVQEFFKEHIVRHFRELSLVIFLAMKKRKDYGMAGNKDRTSISFCRNILGIANYRKVDPWDMHKLNDIVDECDRRNGNKSGDGYINQIQADVFNLFGKEYTNDNNVALYNMLKRLDAPYIFVSSVDNPPYRCRFIVAEYQTTQIGQYTAYMLHKEYARSPQYHLGVVAVPYQSGFIVRREAVEVIFFNKYQHFDAGNGFPYSRRSINSSVNKNVKKTVLRLFGADTKNDKNWHEKLYKAKDRIVSEMEDGILWYEIGTLLNEGGYNPVHEAFQFSLVNQDNIVSVSHRLFFEWNPSKGSRKGAMARFCEIAEIDPRRALRDLYMYISDNWYLDDDEDFMPLATNLNTALALCFFKAGDEIDFNRMAHEIAAIYDMIKSHFENVVKQLLAVIRKSRYQTGINNLGYAELNDRAYKMHRDSWNMRSREDLDTKDQFWKDMVACLRKSSPAGWDEFQAVLAVSSFVFERKILDYVTGGNSSGYNNSLRRYIYRRFIELGVINQNSRDGQDNKAYLEGVEQDSKFSFFYASGIIRACNGEHEKALEFFNNALKTRPWGKDALYHRAGAYKNLGKFERAIKDYTDVLDFEADRVNSLKNRAFCYAKMEQFDSALKDCAEAVKSLHQQANGKAAQGLERALELSSAGYKYFVSGAYPEAIQAYAAAFKKYPGHHLSCLNLALSRIAAGEYEKAGKDLLKIISSVQVSGFIYDAYSLNSVTSAIINRKRIREITETIEKDPRHVLAYLERGKAYERLMSVYSSELSDTDWYNDYRNALENYRMVLKLELFSEAIYPRLGKIHECYAAHPLRLVNDKLESDDPAFYYNQALDWYSKAISRNFYRREALVSRGELYRKLGNNEKARADLNAAREFNKKNSEK